MIAQTFLRNQILSLYWETKCNILQWKIQYVRWFCYAEFLVYYALENNSSKTCKYQPDELDDNLIAINHEKCSYPQKIKLKISGKTMRCQKAKWILQYYVPNYLSPEKFAHHGMVLFFPFRYEKQLLSGYLPMYQSNCKNKESIML